MPMDPGRYRIVVSSPGRGRWVRFAHVEADGATQTVTIRRHGRPDETPEEETGAPTASSGSVTPWTVAGLTAAVAGAGLLGSGLGVGLVAGNRYDDAAAHCVDNQCDPVGTEIRQGALEQATTATVLVVVGSGVLVGGTLLWLLAPSDEDQASDDAAHGHRRDASLALHLAPSGLLLRGAW